MKKCASCQSFCSDDAIRCPDCGSFSIEDFVSDFEGANRGSRRRFTARDDEWTDYTRVSPPQPTLTPGNRINSFETNNNNSSRRNNRANSGNLRTRNGIMRFIIRSTPYLRFIIPIILIVASIIAIVVNWSIIKPVLTCIGVGAILGGGILTYLTRRHFNPDAMIFGAVAGAILACVFQYNILDIGTEISSLIYALSPAFIMLLGIWLMLRSLGS